jgi:hypothetical protein
LKQQLLAAMLLKLLPDQLLLGGLQRVSWLLMTACMLCWLEVRRSADILMGQGL